MSLITFYLFFLLLILSYSNINYTETFEDICHSKLNKSYINNADNFQTLVKLNFELFLCQLIKGIYNNSYTEMAKIFGTGDEMSDCFKEIKRSFHSDKSNFYYHFLSYSGSRINKIGDEKKCVRHRDLTYYLIEMTSNYVNVEEEFQKSSNNKETNDNINEISQYNELYGFLENNKFYLGLCL